MGHISRTLRFKYRLHLAFNKGTSKKAGYVLPNCKQTTLRVMHIHGCNVNVSGKQKKRKENYTQRKMKANQMTKS